jgi:hypothetical protein
MSSMMEPTPLLTSTLEIRQSFKWRAASLVGLYSFETKRLEVPETRHARQRLGAPSETAPLAQLRLAGIREATKHRGQIPTGSTCGKSEKSVQKAPTVQI